MAKAQQKKSSFSSILPMIVIPVALIIGYVFWAIICGDGSHFKGGDNNNDPLPGDYFGTIFKGGFVVPIIVAMLVTVITFTIERFLTLSKATGTGSLDKFVKSVQASLSNNDVSSALNACDKQKGSVANVVRAGLVKYDEMAKNHELNKDQKIIAIGKEVEESTALELPMLERNLPILATIASIATLFGLIGTVLGMIRAFAALAHSGQPDSSALATGISEALINTAFGITTSAIAIIAYNFFTSKIDGLMYRVDETSFSLQNQFAASH